MQLIGHLPLTHRIPRAECAASVARLRCFARCCAFAFFCSSTFLTSLRRWLGLPAEAALVARLIAASSRLGVRCETLSATRWLRGCDKGDEAAAEATTSHTMHWTSRISLTDRTTT